MSWVDFAWRRLVAGLCLYIVGSLNGALIIQAVQEPTKRATCLIAMMTITLIFSEIVWRLIKSHPKTE